MKYLFSHIDWWLVIPVMFLVIISLTVLYSINPLFFRSQIISFIFAIFVFWLISNINYDYFQPFSKIFYLFSIIFFGIVLIIGIESRGAVRWFDVFGISLQPSEIAKPLLSIAFASFLSSHSNRKIKTYICVLLLLIPVFFLIYYQPDLGNALLFAGVFFLTLIIYGISFKWLFITFFPVIFASPFIWNMLHSYQRQRIFTFLNPAADPKGGSYNLIQAIIAVGSGMFFGKGIGEGTQSTLKFLPENHTDFIFASLAEKLGFFGSLIVIITFTILLYRLYTIFVETKELSSKIFICCAFLFVLLQFFVNIAMNIGLVPIVGVTLPFVSFGGSSLLANFIILGIASSISTSGNKKEVLEIR